MTRRQLTNVATAGPTRAPMGQLRRFRTYPAVDDHSIPAPNADTLYTDAWLDVSKEPMVSTTPDMGDRYFQMPMLSGWTNVFQSPGTRATGQRAQTYVIDRSRMVRRASCWRHRIQSANRHCLAGRPYLLHRHGRGLREGSRFAGPDFVGSVEPIRQAIHASADQRRPCSRYEDAAAKQVNAMSVHDYFKYIAELMKTNPPLPQDAPMIAQMASIGLTPGRDFNPSKLSSFDRAAVSSRLAMQRMLERFRDQPTTNGWIYFGPSVGNWGTDYLLRALCNMLGPGWNIPADAVYPVSEKSADGKDYDGNNKYVLRFEKGQMPPVNDRGFWSLTMYDGNRFFVPNALNRYTLSQRDQFIANADGSVSIFLQADPPGKDKEANWLPAPKGKFSVMLRLYLPKETAPSILDGTWKPPPVVAAQ